MNLTHVLAFHRVAVAGSFTLAARLSGVSQPTLSAQVRHLEKSAGVLLFERIGRRIELTPHGEELFGATIRLSTALEDVGDVLRNQKSRLHGHLRISADSAIHVIPILAELKQKTSAFSFSLKTENSAKVIDQVLNDEADVGVMAKSTNDQRLFSSRIRVDELVLVTDAHDSLARKRRAKLTDLAGRDLIVREHGSITREVTQARLKTSNVAMGQIIEVATRESVNEAIAAGLGVGIVFASEAVNDPRLRSVKIENVDVSVSEFVICRHERKHVALIKRFLETAHQVSISKGWLTQADATSAIAKTQKTK
ncbi:MAG: LysR substrate-binding domain-containing protein [Hyphomicrobiaceae bacterium]